MYENYLTAALVIYAIDRLINWYHLHALRSLADEAMFPADDPIMTSSIEAFEYEDEEEESVPPNWEYDAPEAEESPVATPAYKIEEPLPDMRVNKLPSTEEELVIPEIEEDWSKPLPDMQVFGEIEIEEASVPLEGAYGRIFTRCQALTKAGKQCKQKPMHGKKYCYPHKE
ncbi:MAG: hypothetical protein L7U25_06675 [Candidatus Poseidonia sp.]|nr:hypothetical protein [Poseidonia sp.]